MTTRCLRPVLKRYLRFPPIEFIISVCKVGQLHLPQALGKIEIKPFQPFQLFQPFQPFQPLSFELYTLKSTLLI